MLLTLITCCFLHLGLGLRPGSGLLSVGMLPLRDLPRVIKLSPSVPLLLSEKLFFNSFDFTALLTSSSEILSSPYSRVSIKVSYDDGSEHNTIKVWSSLST